MAEPIWKDKTITLGDTSSYPDGIGYRVVVNASTVFEGRAYAKPGAASITVRINDIIAPLLKNVLPIGGQTDRNYLPWAVNVNDGSDWSQLTSGVFFRDWSYEDVLPADLYNEHFCPIIKRVNPLQYLPGYADDGIVEWDCVYDWNTGDFDDDFNLDYYHYGPYHLYPESSVNGTFAFLLVSQVLTALDGQAKLSSIVRDGVTFEVGGCERYVLYYINAFGFWDFLPVEGKTKETDKITRHTYETDYDNATSYNRGKHNHVNELAKQFTFYTCWLNEEQSSLMHHLLNSPCVYVHDLLKGKVHPLVLTNSTTEHKNGGQLYQYSIEAELAQERIRR